MTKETVPEKQKREQPITLEISSDLKTKIESEYLELKIKAIKSKQTAPKKKDYIEYLLNRGLANFNIKDFEKFLQQQRANHK